MSKKEAQAEEDLSSRPAWVLDHNLANLWADGLNEDTIPEQLRLTADTILQIKRLQEWVEAQVAEKEQEQEQRQPPPLRPPRALCLQHRFFYLGEHPSPPELLLCEAARMA